jgi:hypothetical protein
MSRSGLLFAIAVITTGITAPSIANAQWRVPPGKCPEDRRFIEKEMKTTPADGQVYRIQRNATRTPVGNLIRAFGGPKRARGVANATKANAKRRLAAGAQGTMARHWHDTILRAEALILILNCRARPGA